VAAADSLDPVASHRVRILPRSGIRRVLERPTAPDAVSLAAGDPDFATPAHIVAAANKAMFRGETHYTHGKGLIELREAFARKLRMENGIDRMDPAQHIVVTAGALNGLAASFLAIVDPGDEVIVPDPGFANYEAQILLAGGRPIPLASGHATRFLPDLDQLERLAKTATVLVVNTPGNPTGAVIDRETLAGIADIALRYNLLVVADEAYEHLVYDGVRHVSLATLPGMRERTLSIHSMSKSWAMTGWRIGFVSGPATLIDSIATVQEHLIGCPTTMAQWGAFAALSGPTGQRSAMVEHYARRRDLVVASLDGVPGLDLVAPVGAFYAFPRLDIGLEGYELAEAISDGAGVVTIPGVVFGSQGRKHVRLSFALPDDTLAEGLDRLADWLRLRAGSSVAGLTAKGLQ
jgi:aspartate/methionine/tyrosine aminotransferase